MSENGREILEVDVLFVGAGPANLAGAYHLARLVAAHNETAEAKLEPMIAIIEKSSEVGDHILSGAVLDPRAAAELFDDYQNAPPFSQQVTADSLHYLTKGGGLKAPWLPPVMNNHGKYIVSLSDLTKWMAEKVMELGVSLFPGFPGTEMLYDGDTVIGVRTGDKGVDKDGNRKPNYEPGVDLKAKVTVLGEGSRGNLCKQMFARLNMYSPTHPMVYGIGVKELWEIPEGRVKAGTVIHTMGYPLKSEEFGGSFCYAVTETQLSLGLVIGLDYQNPFLDAHDRLQQLKTHKLFRSMLEGGKLLKYGAASMPEGGFYSMPKLYHDGVLVVGDSASFLNGMRLKGIHLGMKSGMLAAETILEALQTGDASANVLSGFETRFADSWAYDELYSTRNFHQAFQGGLFSGMLHAGMQMLTGGRGIKDPWPAPAGHEHMKPVQEYYGKPYAQADGTGGVSPPKLEVDGTLTFDKLTSVYHADTGHEENQPCHLVVRDLDLCFDRCTAEYGNPCQHFCPASVYEWMPLESPAENGRSWDFQINFSNCVHCKTCDIMDPYQVIDWVTPEGGGGPKFAGM